MRGCLILKHLPLATKIEKCPKVWMKFNLKYFGCWNVILEVLVNIYINLLYVYILQITITLSYNNEFSVDLSFSLQNTNI